jgi:hypothetical protein
MSCPEHLQLRERYLAALVEWARVDAGSSSSNGGPEPRDTVLKQRNAARNALWEHERFCPACHRRSPSSFEDLDGTREVYRLSVWHKFDPYDLSTYPEMNTRVQVKFSDGRIRVGQSRDFFPLTLRSTSAEILMWRYVREKVIDPS